MEGKSRVIRLLEWLYVTAYSYRRTVAISLYAAVALLAYPAAYLIRFDFRWPDEYTVIFLWSVALLLAVRVACSLGLQLSTGRWRFVSTRDVLRLVITTTAGTVVFFALTRLLPFTPTVPRSVILLEWVLTTYLTAGLWIAYRVAYERLRQHRSGFNGHAARVLIVGAGEAGNLLAREMSRLAADYRPIGFVDDDPTRLGIRLQGLPVLGATTAVGLVVEAQRVAEIHIAVPSATPAELRRIVELCETTGKPFKVLPGIAEVLGGNVRLGQLREVRIEDLLSREPIQLTLPELAEDLAGRSVLITGAAGSIGSELARQVALHGPANLVLFDQAETDLFYLEMELRERHPRLRLAPVIGDIVEAGTVERVLEEYQPSRIYHAAAYKHVPMMEANPREAIRNNVIGTWRVAEAAGRHRVEKFVLVSTDKAVSPVSVMGATKRLAELVVLEVQDQYRYTTYAAVRFGNVLGSNGSVIPIFKRQLAAGQALTVTHPEATRYFMTIQEAVQLILQASLLKETRGSIAMLEMGEPIRIEDLARNLLRLAGIQGNGNRIVYTGLRPGERLHEELVAPSERTRATTIPKVRLVLTDGHSAGSIWDRLDEWERALREGCDEVIMSSLIELFPSLASAQNGSAGPASVHATDQVLAAGGGA